MGVCMGLWTDARYDVCMGSRTGGRMDGWCINVGKDVCKDVWL